MSYIIEELVGQTGGGGRSPRGRRRYAISGTGEIDVAYGLLLAAAPALWEGLRRQSPRVEELGGGLWDGLVDYGPGEQGELGDCSWSFDIGTTNVHIKHSKATMNRYAPAGKTAPNHKGAINVRRDGSGQTAEGVDVLVPTFTWSETHYAAYELVATHAWITTHEALTATINLTAWRIWAKGELLLLGVSGAKRAEQPVELTYRFASSKTKTGLTIGDITGIDKEGHAYLWVEFEPVEDGAANALSNRPRAAHVERVYDYGEFANLGLPDPWSSGE